MATRAAAFSCRLRCLNSAPPAPGPGEISGLPTAPSGRAQGVVLARDCSQLRSDGPVTSPAGALQTHTWPRKPEAFQGASSCLGEAWSIEEGLKCVSLQAFKHFPMVIKAVSRGGNTHLRGTLLLDGTPQPGPWSLQGVICTLQCSSFQPPPLPPILWHRLPLAARKGNTQETKVKQGGRGMNGPALREDPASPHWSRLGNELICTCVWRTGGGMVKTSGQGLDPRAPHY